MRTKLAVFAVVACVLAPWEAVPASAQSLAEAAAKERERRKGKTTKVVTDAELRSSGRPTATPPELAPAEEGAPAGSASPAPGASPAAEAPQKSDEELRAEKKADLERRLKQQNDIIAATRKMMEQAQLELNDTGNLTFGGRREALMKIMEEHQKEIAQAEAAIEQIREEARRAGVALSL
ncbi:MAG: hypothetical protein AB7O37_06695 [Vicinamibacteria bacterium]